MTVTLTAVEASFQKTEDQWGLLRLKSVDALATFQREKKRGSMRVEDFFDAWRRNGHVMRGKLIFAGPKKPIAIAVRLRQTEFDPLKDQLTVMVEPLDSKIEIPKEMSAIELSFFIEAEDQPFWDKWMGL